MPKEFNPREKKKLSSSFAGGKKLHSVENYELENHKRKYENKLKDQQEELIVSKAMTEGAIKDLNKIIRSLSDRRSKITTREFQALLRGQKLGDLANDVKGSMKTLRGDENEELRNKIKKAAVKELVTKLDIQTTEVGDYEKITAQINGKGFHGAYANCVRIWLDICAFLEKNVSKPWYTKALPFFERLLDSIVNLFTVRIPNLVNYCLDNIDLSYRRYAEQNRLNELGAKVVKDVKTAGFIGGVVDGKRPDEIMSEYYDKVQESNDKYQEHLKAFKENWGSDHKDLLGRDVFKAYSDLENRRNPRETAKITTETVEGFNSVTDTMNMSLRGVENGPDRLVAGN